MSQLGSTWGRMILCPAPLDHGRKILKLGPHGGHGAPYGAHGPPNCKFSFPPCPGATWAPGARGPLSPWAPEPMGPKAQRTEVPWGPRAQWEGKFTIWGPTCMGPMGSPWGPIWGPMGPQIRGIFLPTGFGPIFIGNILGTQYQYHTPPCELP